MAAVAHSPAFAKKVGIPTSVGREFNQADKGRKFAEGGIMAKGKAPFFGKESAKEERAEKKMGKAAYMRGERSEGEAGFKCGGKAKGYAKGGGIESRGKTKGKFV